MKNYKLTTTVLIIVSSILASIININAQEKNGQQIGRTRILINDNWKFFKYASAQDADTLIYDIRPDVTDKNDNKVADSKPTEAVAVTASEKVLKPWILPTANKFIKDPAKQHKRPAGNPGGNFAFVQNEFNDADWETVTLPHDWAIKGPFYTGWDAIVGGGMGRLPIQGVAWYRKKLNIPASDKGKNIYLEVEGAMSYAMVWLNGTLIGGWPYGYNSWQLDLTPYIKPGGDNQLAIRLDNPNYSARWYPGGGIYRNLWLIKTNPVHVSQYGTFITTKECSAESAKLNIEVNFENTSTKPAQVEVSTQLYQLQNDQLLPTPDATLNMGKLLVSPGSTANLKGEVTLTNPKLWGPPPTQQPNLYVAITTFTLKGKVIDRYETRFGIRQITFNPNEGIFVNGEHIRIQGANQHHDLGALGVAFNKRAAERQLEILREAGCNAIRLSHNPPAPELLELTDKMGFLVINEIFDSWERKKTPHDFHLIFPDWYEADTRAYVHRDRNCPSVIMWSFGNEVGEQYTGVEGAKIGKLLYDIVKEEDPTRPTTTAMNYAKPDMELPKVPDVIGLNYQGEGIRDAAAYAHLKGIRTPPLYSKFHEKFPDKVIVSSESASALSTRGTFIFPVYNGISAPVSDSTGGDPKNYYVSAYELYTSAFGASADKVFTSQDKNPYVAGEFVWSGWDYIGEPTPYYEARSSYSGFIDLAGFKKERFYLYQSRWRPDFPMVHILPHWNWPDRGGKITPVHVFTSGNEVELFLNGKSMGRKMKQPFEYRLRWDSIVYEPGELKAVAYKNGIKWSEEVVKTTGEATGIKIEADRTNLKADGIDLSFITVKITDNAGLVVPVANNEITFTIDGPGEIAGTDNGDPSNMESFASSTRKAFNGLCLGIIRTKKGAAGLIKVTVTSPGLKTAEIVLKSN